MSHTLLCVIFSGHPDDETRMPFSQQPTPVNVYFSFANMTFLLL